MNGESVMLLTESYITSFSNFSELLSSYNLTISCLISDLAFIPHLSLCCPVRTGILVGLANFVLTNVFSDSGSAVCASLEGPAFYLPLFPHSLIRQCTMKCSSVFPSSPHPTNKIKIFFFKFIRLWESGF